METDYWKDEIMNCLKGIQRVEPNPYLFARIEAKLERPRFITVPTVRWAAIGLTVLLTLNTWAVLSFNKTKGFSESKSSYILSYFQSY